MAITDWPHNERPREKLLNHGVGALSDAELLAIFLRTGVRGKSAVDLARDLLNEFGDLRALLEAKAQTLCKQRGLGIAKYAQLHATLELSRRHLRQSLQRYGVIQCPEDTRQYLTACLRDYQHEVFACLFLDNRFRIIAFKELFHGTINSATVHPREVVKAALAHNAAAVVLAHNHPSGVADPSLSDKKITQRLVAALELIEVRVLDHLIIGDGQVTSFAEQGLLN